MYNNKNCSFREYVVKIIVRTEIESESEDLEEKLDDLEMPSLLGSVLDLGTLNFSLIGNSLRKNLSSDTSFAYEFEVNNVQDVTGEDIDEYL